MQIFVCSGVFRNLNPAPASAEIGRCFGKFLDRRKLKKKAESYESTFYFLVSQSYEWLNRKTNFFSPEISKLQKNYTKSIEKKWIETRKSIVIIFWTNVWKQIVFWKFEEIKMKFAFFQICSHFQTYSNLMNLLVFVHLGSILEVQQAKGSKLDLQWASWKIERNLKVVKVDWQLFLSKAVKIPVHKKNENKRKRLGEILPHNFFRFATKMKRFLRKSETIFISSKKSEKIWVHKDKKFFSFVFWMKIRSLEKFFQKLSNTIL